MTETITKNINTHKRSIGMNNDTSRLEDFESDCILFLTFMREVESRRFSIGEDLTASSPMPTSGQQQGIVSFLHDKGIQDHIPIFAAMRFYVFEAFKTMMHQQSYNIGEAFWTSFYECPMGSYPFGGRGKPGVHNDVVSFLSSPSISTISKAPLHAILAQQFMTKHTLCIVHMCKENSPVTDARVEQYRASLLGLLERLPSLSQQLLQNWVTIFVMK